jgi:hypothetical protein
LSANTRGDIVSQLDLISQASSAMPQKKSGGGWSPLDKLLKRWSSRPLPEAFAVEPLFTAVPIVMVNEILTPGECADAISFAEDIPFEEVCTLV